MRVTHDEDAQAKSRVQARRVGPGAMAVTHTVVPVPTVGQSPHPYHEMQNWKYENQTWKGEYRAPGVRCAGEIWQHYGKFCARIANIPEAVLRGPHSACFAPDPELRGWHRIHFARMPKTIDGAILAVEQTLQESR
jgi:hypothetical protein